MIYAKKSLGQNFLRSEKVIADIVDAAQLTGDETVLEIGPGHGILTEKLLSHARKVIAVEKDRRLIPILKEKFPEDIASGKLTLIEQDVLEFKPEDHGLMPQHYAIIANIPYYITGELMQKFLEESAHPHTMVLMVQKEVANRITDKKKGSILGMSVRAYGYPKYVRTVPRSFFTPSPNVDSAVIAIHRISKDFFKDFEEKWFFRVLKAGFGHKRKQLVGNLKEFADRESILSIFHTLNLKETCRAEDLSIEDWSALSQNLKKA
jgi:16S rRNA (adenine1518-N6/adenine1519-N6)-dimethyltransferase